MTLEEVWRRLSHAQRQGGGHDRSASETRLYTSLSHSPTVSPLVFNCIVTA